MSDYTIIHHPDEANPWFVMDCDLVFDTFKEKADAVTFIAEMDTYIGFSHDLQKLVEQYADNMDLSHIEFIRLVEFNIAGTLRGL